MATENKDKLLEGIAYFEQILQMMPEDRATLEFLCIAYPQVGDHAKYQQTLVKLAQVLVKERDLDGANKLLEDLKKRNDPEIKAVELKIRAMLAPFLGDAVILDSPGGEGAGGSGVGFNDRLAAIKAEVSLVRWLESNRVVEQELAQKVCDQLQAFGTVPGEFLISAMVVLERESSVVADAAAACIADATQIPPIALEMFDQYTTLVKEMPEKIVRIRGVVPFGKVADEILVALANPMDQELRHDVSMYFGGKCHFFFAPPQSLSIVLGKLFPEEAK